MKKRQKKNEDALMHYRSGRIIGLMSRYLRTVDRWKERWEAFDIELPTIGKCELPIEIMEIAETMIEACALYCEIESEIATLERCGAERVLRDELKGLRDDLESERCGFDAMIWFLGVIDRGVLKEKQEEGGPSASN